MSRKIVCDKCGKIIEAGNFMPMRIDAGLPYSSTSIIKNLDICEECIFEGFNPLDLMIKTNAGYIERL